MIPVLAMRDAIVSLLPGGVPSDLFFDSLSRTPEEAVEYKDRFKSKVERERVIN